MDVFGYLESTAAAVAIRDSLLLTAGLSAVHALAFTLVMGSALLLNLRWLGWMFRERPLHEIAGPARGGFKLGITLSLITGALQFLPRAVAVSHRHSFQLKMAFLVAALMVTGFQLRSRGTAESGGITRPLSGAIGLMLWLGLGLSACALILLE